MELASVFAEPLVDLGTDNPAFAGIHTPRSFHGATKVGVTSQFLENAEQYHKSYFDTGYWNFLLGNALAATGITDAPRRIIDIGSGSGNSVIPLADRFPEAQIVATDIDTNVLATAAEGVYGIERVDTLAPERLKRFFLRGKGAQAGMARVRPELRQLVTFRQLNLLADGWPLAGQFDAIFCRNVMIYFDKATQRKILARFVPLMKPHALLFAGHSENFLYVSESLRLRGKTVYELDERHG